MNKRSWSILIGVLIVLILVPWVFAGGVLLAGVMAAHQLVSHSVGHGAVGSWTWSTSSSCITINGTTYSSSRKYIQRKTQTVPMPISAGISIVDMSGDITVVPGPAGSVRIDEVRFGPTLKSLAAIGLSVSSQGRNLTITGGSRSGDREVGGIDLTVYADPSATLDLRTEVGNVKVNGFNGGIVARSGSGDIGVARSPGKLNLSTDVGNVSVKAANGDVDASSGSGNVTADGTLAPGSKLNTDVGQVVAQADMRDVDAHSGSGNVTLAGSVGSGTTATTDVGNVDVTNADGALRATSGSGNVTVRGRLSGSNDISSDVGNVDVTLSPPDTSIHVIASTSDGSAHNDFGLSTTTDYCCASFSGAIGDGSGGDVHITSGSGNVSLKRG